jgi:hypothetical protein
MAAEAANGMLLSNHSYIYLTGWSWWGTGWVWWGDTTVSRTTDYTFGFYMSDARTVDSIAYLAPYYLVCKAAGNEMFVGPANQPVAHQVWTPSGYYPSTWVRNLNGGPNGYDCISSGFGVSKNILTLGAVNAIPNGYSSPADVVLASFSSTGPTDDGRIKPDLVTDGVGLYSTLTANNTAYGYSSGTSMATPGATGSLALLQEHYHNLHGNYMLASMLRGLAIHTADEAGTAPGPDYRFGWGLLDIAKAATVLSRQCSNAVIRDTLQNGETYILELKTKSSQPLTATLCWTDPPGVPPPNVLNPPNLMLVNDLDMRIDSTVYKPWTLDPANVTAAASTGDNFRDNVEKIVIPNPPTGKHILKITHKNSLSGGSQVFSLIISGIDSVMTPGTAGNPQSVCYNTAPAALSATPPLGGAPPYTYQWQQSNDNVIFLDIPGANALTYQPGPLTGNFWYRLVQTPSGSCQGAITNSVAVLVLPLVVPGITGPSETCVNSTETYSTESGMTDYSWEVSPGNTIVSGAGTNQISVAWNTSGIQWVKVSYTNAAGCSAMAPTQSDILVNPHPPAPVITQNGYVLSSNAPTGNQWYHDGNILPSDTASSMVVSQNGWYWDVVTLDGCSSDSSNNIYVIIESSDDLADDFPGNFTVYPLPGNGDFHIAFSSFPGTRLTAELINSLGQSVRLQTLDLSGTQSSFRLDFRPLPAGLYTLLIRTSETTCTRKVLITK